MPLRIIIFEGSLQPPVFIRRLIEGLIKAGHEVFLLHFGNDKKSGINNLHYISLGNSRNLIFLIFQSLRYAFNEGFAAVRETFKIITAGNKKNLYKRNLCLRLKEIKPDVIHVQWPAFLDVLEEVIEEGKYPVILSQRGYQVNVKPYVHPAYFKNLEAVFPKLSGFHSVSKAISERGDEIWTSAAKVDNVVYTGVDLNTLAFKNDYSKNKKLQILTVGRPHWKKGLHDVVSACGILSRDEINFELTIIGGIGNEEILFLKHFYNLEDKVKISGKVPMDIVYKLMSESDLLVVSSIEEGIPNVLVEAMALGLPVISTSCGGVEEVIQNGIQGWVVPTRDPVALADQIRYFYSLPHHEIEMVRKAARQKIEDQHSYGQMIEGMESLYIRTIEQFRI